MIAVIVGIIWLGYGVSSWGYVLTQGWDIPAGQWFNLVHPYEYPPKGTPIPTVPPGVTLPPGTASAAASSSAAGQGGSAAAQPSTAPVTPSPGQAPPVIGER